MNRTAVLVAIALTVLGASPAAAESSPPPTPSSSDAPGTYIEFAGSYANSYTDQNGTVVAQDPIASTLRITCDGDDCSFMTIRLGDTFQFPFDGTTLQWSEPSTGSLCSNNFQAGGTMSMVVDADAITLTSHRVGIAESCPNEITQFEADSVFTGTYSAGDECVLAGSACAPEVAPTAVPVAGGASAGASRTPATPSVLSSLATPDQTLSPTQVALAAALTVVLVILMAIPTHLLNTAIDTGSGRVSEWFARRRKPDAPAPATPKSRYPGLVPAAGGVLAAGIISAFVDPTLGFDAASVRVVISVLVSFGIEVVLGWFVLVWLVKRTHPSATATFRFAPATLLVVVATVLFTRLTGFEPGIVFGLVAGVAFGTALATAEKARVALLGLGYAFGLAILAWIGYTLLGGIADPNAILVFVRETLAAVTIAGIAALPIALIPLRGLTGFEVFSWNRIAWGVAYAVGLLGFFLVLMPMPTSWGAVHASLWTWVGLYLAYAAVAVVVWLVVVRPWHKNSADVSQS